MNCCKNVHETDREWRGVRTLAFRLFSNRFIRFLLVGAVNTLFGYAVFALFLYLGFHYALAILVATLLGTLFNFKTTGIIVFKSNDNNLIVKFIGVYAVIYAINTGFLKFFNILQINMFISGAIVIPTVAVIGFLLNSRFVFKEQP